MLDPQTGAQRIRLDVQVFAYADKAEWSAILYRKDPIVRLDVLDSLERSPIIAIIQITSDRVFKERGKKIAFPFKAMISPRAVELFGQN